MVKQPYYNYKATHSNGKYVFLDGKSGLNYRLSDTSQECEISYFKVGFDICMPVEISSGYILSDFLGETSSESNIYINEDKALVISFPIYLIETTVDENGEEQEIEVRNIINVVTNNDIISVGEYASFEIVYENNNIYVYKNNILVFEYQLSYSKITNLPTVLRVGYNSNLENPYKGFIKNVSLNIIGIEEVEDEQEEIPNVYTININLPYKNKLEDSDKKYEYTNYGARFITTPQLIDDKTNLDIYGNALMGKR
jgi:hypothetical protein